MLHNLIAFDVVSWLNACWIILKYLRNIYDVFINNAILYYILNNLSL